MRFMDKEIYEEACTAADDFRLSYAKGIDSFLSALGDEMKAIRKSRMSASDFPMRIEEYRNEYRDMLGLTRIPKAASSTFKRHLVAKDAFAEIYRVTLTVCGTIPFYGILMLPPHKEGERLPLVIAQHGGGGTPELLAGFHGKNNYQSAAQRCLSRGAAVFCPQLLLWNIGEAVETCPTHEGAPYDRTLADVKLKKYGMSMAALEINAISEAITALSEEDWIDGQRVGMLGLSYGGFYTLYTMAADPRIGVGFSAAVFNDRDVYAWEDMTFKDSGLLFQDAEVAALCAPRPLYIAVGKSDTVFDYRHSPAEAMRVQPYYAAFLAEDRFRYELWEGGHTFPTEGEGFEFFLSALGL